MTHFYSEFWLQYGNKEIELDPEFAKRDGSAIQELHEKWMEDPEYRKEYERISLEWEKKYDEQR